MAADASNILLATEKSVRETCMAITADEVSRVEDDRTVMKEATKKMVGEMDVCLKGGRLHSVPT